LTGEKIYRRKGSSGVKKKPRMTHGVGGGVLGDFRCRGEEKSWGKKNSEVRKKRGKVEDKTQIIIVGTEVDRGGGKKKRRKRYKKSAGKSSGWEKSNQGDA